MNLVIEAPRHRFFSVLALLLECKAEILNQSDLESSALARKPLQFRFEVVDAEDVRIGLAELRREYEGEEFILKGAGQ